MNNTNETFVADVITFNRDLLGIAPRKPGLMLTPEFNHLIKCIHEETNELIDAHAEGNVVSCVDAIIDMMYFAIGGLHKMGISHAMIVECMQTVHAANMTKVKAKVAKRYVEGAVDAGKPDDFVPPEAAIAKILGLHPTTSLCTRAIDAQAMAVEHPATFGAPSAEDLAGICIGDHVKICTGEERFWVEVEDLEGDTVRGRIDNQLVCSVDHGLYLDDRVSFERRHVYATLSAREK